VADSSTLKVMFLAHIVDYEYPSLYYKYNNNT
jgi:hypothetical protein